MNEQPTYTYRIWLLSTVNNVCHGTIDAASPVEAAEKYAACASESERILVAKINPDIYNNHSQFGVFDIVPPPPPTPSVTQVTL